MATRTAQRPMGELSPRDRTTIENLLSKDPAALIPSELAHLRGRREYLTPDQVAYYGLDKAPAPQPKPENEDVSRETPDEAVVCDPGFIAHVVTREDLEANPGLANEGVEIGETICIPEVDEDEEEEEKPFDREAAKARLTELGVEFKGNAKNTVLQELLEKAEAEAEDK